MIKINDMLLDTTMLEIIQELKRQLNACGVMYFNAIRDSGENIMVSCPYHKDGMESKPSCGIHKETGVVHCFTCGASHTLPDMIGFCFGRGEEDSFLFGMNWLRKEFQEIEVEERPDIELDYRRNSLPHDIYTYVPDMVLEQYRYTHPYMYKRKLNDDVIELFDIGYDKETNCITFPVRDIYGNCLFVGRRAVDRKWFHYPSGAHKPLYGVYELKVCNNIFNEVVVCESMFNCLTCWAHGIPAIALNGTGSYEQIQELKKLPCRSVVLALDPDDAGRHGMNKIKNALRNKIVYTVDYKDGRDINDLEEEEVEELFKTKHLM